MHNNEFQGNILRFLSYFGGLLSILFWILLIYGFDEPYAAGITLLCAIIHESGHVAVSQRLGGRGKVKGALSGLRLGGVGFISYKEDFIFAAAGPLANIISAAAILPFLGTLREYGVAFVSIALATAAANLLPVRGHDGYNMLRAVTCHFDVSGRGLRALEWLSGALTVGFCVASLYLMDRFGEGYWIFGIFYASLVSDIGRRLE